MMLCISRFLVRCPPNGCALSASSQLSPSFRRSLSPTTAIAAPSSFSSSSSPTPAPVPLTPGDGVDPKTLGNTTLHEMMERSVEKYIQRPIFGEAQRIKRKEKSKGEGGEGEMEEKIKDLCECEYGNMKNCGQSTESRRQRRGKVNDTYVNTGGLASYSLFPSLSPPDAQLSISTCPFPWLISCYFSLSLSLSLPSMIFFPFLFSYFAPSTVTHAFFCVFFKFYFFIIILLFSMQECERERTLSG